MKMSIEQLFAKREELMSKEKDNPVRLHYLSFADPDRPEGTQFLGAAIVSARGFVHATMRAGILGINPGGEVKGVEVPEDVEYLFPEEQRDRLLSMADLQALGHAPTRWK